MKKLIYTFGAALMMLASVSCEKKDTVKSGDQPAAEKVSMTFRSVPAGAVKTTVNPDGATVVWSEGDAILVFASGVEEGSVCEMTSDEWIGSDYAEFNGQCANKGPWVSICPASASEAYSGGTITLNLPAEQQFAGSTFAVGAMPCVAYSETTDFTFNHVCGVIKFSFKGEGVVDYIRITDKNGKKLNGTFTVTPMTSTAAVKSGDDGTESITLNCGADGVELSKTEAKEFWFVAPAGAFDKGFEAVVVSKDGKLAKVGSKNDQTIEEGIVLSMPELSIEFNKSAQEWEFKSAQGWEMVNVL